MTTTPELSSRLATFAADLQWADIPEPARQSARRILANAVGLAIGASDHDSVRRTIATLADLGLHGDSSVLGREESLPVTWAALVTGMAIHVEDFDDTHLRTVLHPGAPIVSAVLAVAQRERNTGQQVLSAIVAGTEVSARVGNGLGNAHFNRGWHVTGTMGHLGAVVAAGHLLGLTAAQMTHAISIASTQAQGHTEQLGSMTKALHPGKAAYDGAEAAYLARDGFTGPAAPIEGRRGMAALMSTGIDFDAIEASLGSVWEAAHVAFKPYACGIVSHPVIDAGVSLRRRGVAADQLVSVSIVVNPIVLDVMGIADPTDGLLSKFSVYHCFAVGLMDGAAGPLQFGDARSRDAATVAVRGKVMVTVDAAMPRDACRVTILLADGSSLTEEVAHATGSVDSPLTIDRLRTKFLNVAEPVIGEAAADLWNLLERLDAAADLDDVFALARVPVVIR